MNIRRAEADDAPACAAIVRAWLDTVDWMPGGPSEAELERMMRAGFPIREAWVAEDADGRVQGYVSLKGEEDHIMGLYARIPGEGVGRALMDHLKDGRDRLTLRTHMPNRAAHRFYEREGFVLVADALDGEDGVGERLMEWTR